MVTIAVLNYGAGNLFSIKMGLEKANAKVEVVTFPFASLEQYDGIVLPGVGAFTPAVDKINQSKDVLLQALAEGKSLLGICLGLQLLLTRSSEGEITEGLNLVRGDVVKLPEVVKVPQIGWNTIEIVQENPLFEGIDDNSYFYFVHSFIGKSVDEQNIIARTNYGEKFPSVIADKNIYATQFHPEKSSKVGAKLLENFVTIIKR